MTHTGSARINGALGDVDAAWKWWNRKRWNQNESEFEGEFDWSGIILLKQCEDVLFVFTFLPIGKPFKFRKHNFLLFVWWCWATRMIVIDTVGLGGYPTYGFFWGGATGPPFWITGVMYVVKHLGLDHWIRVFYRFELLPKLVGSYIWGFPRMVVPNYHGFSY